MPALWNQPWLNADQRLTVVWSFLGAVVLFLVGLFIVLYGLTSTGTLAAKLWVTDLGVILLVTILGPLSYAGGYARGVREGRVDERK